jgi:hypothetical protein
MSKYVDRQVELKDTRVVKSTNGVIKNSVTNR